MRHRRASLVLVAACSMMACKPGVAPRGAAPTASNAAARCPVWSGAQPRSDVQQVLDQRRAEPVVALAFSPREATLAALSDTGRVAVWDLSRRTLLAVRGAPRSPEGADGAELRWDDERHLRVTGGAWPATVLDARSDVSATIPMLDGRALILPSPPAQRSPGWITVEPDGITVRDGAGASLAPLPGLERGEQRTLGAHVAATPEGDAVVLQSEGVALRWRLRGSSVDGPERIPTPPFTAVPRVPIFPADSGGLHMNLARQLLVGEHGALRVVLHDGDAVVLRDREAPFALGGPHGEAHAWESLALSPDARWLAAISDDAISLIELSTRRLAWSRVLLGGGRGGGEMRGCACFRSVAFSADGASLALGTGDGRVMLYDAPRGSLLATLGRSEAPWAVRDLAFENSATLHTLSRAPSPENAYDLPNTPRGLRGTYSRTSWRLDEVAVRQDIDDTTLRLATLGDAVVRVEYDEDATCEGGGLGVRVRPMAGGPARQVGCLRAHEKIIDLDAEHALALIEGERNPYVGGTEVFLADLRTGTRSQFDAVYRELDSAEHSEDGRWFIAWWSERNGMIPYLIDVGARSAQGIPREAFPTEGAGPMALSADGSRLATSGGGKVRALSLPGLALLWEATVPAEVTSLAWRSTGLVAGLDDGRVMTAEDGRVRVAPSSTRGPAAMLRVSRDGRRAATVTESGAVVLWDLAGPTQRATLTEYAPEEWLVSTPDGYHAGAPEAARRVGWVFDDPFERFDFDRFAATDGTLARVRAALRDAPPATRPTRPRPPRVVIERAEAHGAVAEVVARVSSGSRVDRVSAFVEGRPVFEGAVCQSEATVRISAPLHRGKNRVTVVAFDASGVASNLTDVDLDGPADAARPDVWVVAVGVGRYPRLPAAAQLVAAPHDATGISAAYEGLSGDGRPFAHAHVVTLLDEAATPRAITEAIGGLRAMAPDDVAVVLLAGHGIRAGEGAETVFLTSGVRSAADVAGASVGWTALASSLASAPGRVVVLLDACHGGHFQRENLLPNEALAAALSREGRAGVVVFSASRGAEESLEGSVARGLRVANEDAQPSAPTASVQDAHGVFTGAWLRALGDAETDADRDGVVRFSEIAARVIDRVSVDTGGAQTPWITRREVFGDFAVLPPSR